MNTTHTSKNSSRNLTSIRSKAHFLAIAQSAFTVMVGKVPMQAQVKQFSTGSVGWYVNHKLNVQLGDSLENIQGSINGQPVLFQVKEFSSGKWGWYHGGKQTIELTDGTLAVCQVGANLTITKSDQGVTYGGIATVQVGINITLVGSKEMPATDSVTKVA